MASAPVLIPGDPPPVILNGGDTAIPAAAAPDLAAPLATDEPVDEFAKMFSSFAQEGDAPTPAVVTDPAAPAPVVAAASEIVAPADPAPTPAAPAAPAHVPDPMERLADILTQRQPQQQQPYVPPTPPPSFFTAEEATALNSFYTDWPEIAKAQELSLRAAVHQTSNHIFTEVARVLGPRLALLENLANNSQYDNIAGMVPDYDDVQDKVAAWVGTQPKYLKDAYTGVMQTGTPEEVIDLIGRYRQATGTTAPALHSAAGGQPTLAPAARPSVLSPAAIQAAARLAPVSGKRTATQQGEPTGFDDAFAAFSKV